MTDLVLHSLLNSPESLTVIFTDTEYLINNKHNELPTERLEFNFSIAKGEFQSYELNFEVFIEAKTLCLECSNYSRLSITEESRKDSIGVMQYNNSINSLYSLGHAHTGRLRHYDLHAFARY